MVTVTTDAPLAGCLERRWPAVWSGLGELFGEVRREPSLRCHAESDTMHCVCFCGLDVQVPELFAQVAMGDGPTFDRIDRFVAFHHRTLDTHVLVRRRFVLRAQAEATA